MQRTIVFKDARRTKVVVEIEITDGRFSMSGQYGNGSGQIVDDIKPANAAQQDLVNLWREHHLNDLKPGTPAQMAALKSLEYEAICDTIAEAEEATKDRRVNVMPDTELLVYADENSDDLPDWVDGEDTTLVALGLAKILNLSLNELSDISHEGGNRWTVQGTEYLAGTDEDMTKELADNIRESVWAFNAEFIADHCSVDIDIEMIKMWQREKYESANEGLLKLIDDFDQFVEDAEAADGRGHFLNDYDGTEEMATVEGVDIYACQQ